MKLLLLVTGLSVPSIVLVAWIFGKSEAALVASCTSVGIAFLAFFFTHARPAEIRAEVNSRIYIHRADIGYDKSSTHPFVMIALRMSLVNEGAEAEAIQSITMVLENLKTRQRHRFHVYSEINRLAPGDIEFAVSNTAENIGAFFVPGKQLIEKSFGFVETSDASLMVKGAIWDKKWAIFPQGDYRAQISAFSSRYSREKELLTLSFRVEDDIDVSQGEELNVLPEHVLQRLVGK